MKKRRLTKLRLAFWLVTFGVLTGFLIFNTNWGRVFKTDYRPYTAEGQPVVAAIYEFRNQRGLWPQDAGDLAPKFIAKVPGGWNYVLADGWPQVIHEVKEISGKPKVAYDFDPNHLGWFVFGVVMNEPLAITQAVPAAPVIPAEEMQKRILAEYERRIRSAPDVPENWQAKGAYLHAIGRQQELQAFISQAADFRPFYFWPQMAAAMLEVESAKMERDKGTGSAGIGHPFAGLPAKPVAATGAASGIFAASTSAATGAATSAATNSPPLPKTAGERFVAFAVAQPTFTHYYYVCVYARAAGDQAAAIRAAELAMTRPIEVADDDAPLDRYFYLYRLARFAYEAREYGLCLQICGEWAEVNAADRQKGSAGNRSYLPLAAAANLALGDFERAIALANQCGTAEYRGPRLMARNYDDLARAAKAHEVAYVYRPNPTGGEPEYDPFMRFDK